MFKASRDEVGFSRYVGALCACVYGFVGQFEAVFEQPVTNSLALVVVVYPTSG